MATFYFDSVNGSDSNSGTSAASPWASFEAKRAANVFAGDTVFIKRGTTQTINLQFAAMRGGTTAAAPSRVLAYGEGPRPRWLFTGTFWGYIFNFANMSHMIFEDQDFDGGGQSSTIYLAAQGTSASTGVTFRRCLFHNSGTRGAMVVTKEGSATTATCGGHLFEDCDFYDAGEHGFIAIAAVGVTLRRCRAFRNGNQGGTGGGHGFSSRWGRSDVTSGWTLVSGTTFKRAFTPAENAEGNVGYVQSPLVNRNLVTKNTVTPTVLTLDQFGQSAGELYVNLGQNPNGLAIRYATQRCANIVYEDCLAFDNYVNEESEFQEGNGFAFDDFTEDSRFTRCRSWGNQGRGFSINRGDRNVLEDSAAWGNGLNGVGSNTSLSTVIRRCTVAFNNRGNYITPVVASAHEIVFSPQAGAAITETVVAALPGTSFCINDSLASVTVDRCSLSGATATALATPTNAVTGDPLLTETGAPRDGSPVIRAGTYSGYVRDVRRTQRARPPSIGAYDVAVLRPRAA